VRPCTFTAEACLRDDESGCAETVGGWAAQHLSHSSITVQLASHGAEGAMVHTSALAAELNAACHAHDQGDTDLRRTLRVADVMLTEGFRMYARMLPMLLERCEADRPSLVVTDVRPTSDRSRTRPVIDERFIDAASDRPYVWASTTTPMQTSTFAGLDLAAFLRLPLVVHSVRAGTTVVGRSSEQRHPSFRHSCTIHTLTGEGSKPAVAANPHLSGRHGSTRFARAHVQRQQPALAFSAYPAREVRTPPPSRTLSA
jgi:hypothetical protein